MEKKTKSPIIGILMYNKPSNTTNWCPCNLY